MSKSHAEAELAIQAFADLLRVERLLDDKMQRLQAAVVRVPQDQMNFYVAETEAMRAADEELRGKRKLPAGR